MPKRPSIYHRLDTLERAWKQLQQPGVHPLGGGTKLLAGKLDVELVGVVDLQALGLSQIRRTDAGHLHVGATARLADLAAFLQEETADTGPTTLLQQAIHRAGPNTYRNAATLGGAIASRLPDSELLATLLALDAELSLYTPDSETMTLVDYLGPEIRPSGLITHVTIPWTGGRGESARVARTPADDPIVSVTVWQPAGDTPRLAATGIGKRPLRLKTAEAHGQDTITEKTIEQAATAARKATTHPGDFRGDADYRAEMAAVVTRRALQTLR